MLSPMNWLTRRSLPDLTPARKALLALLLMGAALMSVWLMNPEYRSNNGMETLPVQAPNGKLVLPEQQEQNAEQPTAEPSVSIKPPIPQNDSEPTYTENEPQTQGPTPAPQQPTQGRSDPVQPRQAPSTGDGRSDGAPTPTPQAPAPTQQQPNLAPAQPQSPAKPSKSNPPIWDPEFWFPRD